MTEKQIMDEIRMFKCVWCKYDFKENDANFILSENPNECVCNRCMTEWADYLLGNFKLKEQECKEKQETAQDAISNLCAEKSALYNELDQLKQTLTEIKEVLQLYSNGKIGTDKGNGIFEFEVSSDNGNLIYCYDTNPAKRALQKINEVYNDR